ncbi:MAG: Mur ligase family protein [Candidatus Thermoplasmatota archaeon]|nr:Mur ligase family protein [Candidatus Thermoplasmatota archaeon]
MDPVAYLNSLGQFKILPGLERMEHVLLNFGEPHLEYPSVHIGGTNGKGSTAAILGSILEKFGLSSGIYTSPHLMRLTERIRFDGEEVSLSELSSMIELIRINIEKNGPPQGLTYFELLTCAYFLLCRSHGPDVSIVEVGMGGRWDATNTIEPHAVCITSISFDHMKHLGGDLTSIAREKAGIIKTSTPVVIGPLRNDALESMRPLKVILETCTMNGCPVIALCLPENERETMRAVRSMGLIDHRVISIRTHPVDQGTMFDLKIVDRCDSGTDPCFDLIDIYIPGEHICGISGEYQAGNAACATALSLLVLPATLARRRLDGGDMSASDRILTTFPEELTDGHSKEEITKKLASGLEIASIPGRMEIRKNNGRILVIDGAHNPEASVQLLGSVRSMYPDKRIHLLLSMMEDKDVSNFCTDLISDLESATLLELPMDRSMELNRLVEGVAHHNVNSIDVFTFREPGSAIRHWISELGSDEDIGLACGSFYLYGYIDSELGP